MDKRGGQGAVKRVWASEYVLYPSELGAMRVRFPKLGWTGYPEAIRVTCKL